MSRGLPNYIRISPKGCAAHMLGLASEAAIRHLTSLGITAVELMPVHHFLQ